MKSKPEILNNLNEVADWLFFQRGTYHRLEDEGKYNEYSRYYETVCHIIKSIRCGWGEKMKGYNSKDKPGERQCKGQCPHCLNHELVRDWYDSVTACCRCGGCGGEFTEHYTYSHTTFE